MSPYAQLIERLYSRNLHLGVKLGLSNMEKLNSLQDHPHRQFSCIHIAGTNGKGSVAAKIAKGLESRFNKVGLFTSPHIATFRERIRINGKMIAETEAASLLTELLTIAEKENISATFFELTTQLAFQHFATEKVDIAILETGLGGRLDATNIISPKLAIITSLHLDHTEILGDTIEKIAKEKAGILKPGVPTILGPSACSLAPIAPRPVTMLSGPFTHFEEENNAIATEALQFFGIPNHLIKDALTTRLPCRQETLHYNNQKVILDVGHNPEALRRLFEGINRSKLIVLCALSKTKDHRECLKVIDKNAEHIHLVEAPNGRCAPPQILEKILLERKRPPNTTTAHSSIEEGLTCALINAKPQGQTILVCGSFFIMEGVRKYLGISESRDPRGTKEKFLIGSNRQPPKSISTN